MNAFGAYLTGRLDALLREKRVVVWYDRQSEFAGFIDELEPIVPPEGRGGFPRVWLNDLQAHVARYDGSFFALKQSLEPIVALDQPDPLLVYVAGVARDHEGSVLMELEKGGECHEWRLRGLARQELRRRFTDGEIDEMLAPEGIGYADVARLLSGERGDQASLLKLALGDGSSEALITRWIADETRDAVIEEKGATGELYKLVQARLGLALEPSAPLAKARHQTARYVLVEEFRGDLSCAAPKELGVVPASPTKEHHKRLRDVSETLRRRAEYGERYAQLADGIEKELGLSKLGVPGANLGSIDTFRFEERVLLAHAADLVAHAKYADAIGIAADRGPSFWLDREVGRRAQWEACRLAADLGREVERVQPLVKKTTGGPEKWVDAYAADGGWSDIDRAQRALEAWVAKMEDEPEELLEKAIALVRRAHETLLKEMAEGFTDALVAGKWSVPRVLHQTRIYPELVDKAGGRVAYFLVDAMRYEMGVDLAKQLGDGNDLKLVPAIAALPSITPIGMAALLPNASASFSVVEHKGKLASRIDDSILPDLTARMRFLKARRPDSADIELGELLQRSSKWLGAKLEGVSVFVVRSQAIDALGEVASGQVARHIMDTIVGNVARAVRKLAKLGVQHFVITADHGHQFSIRKEEDMTMEKPGGAKVDQHRRCWAGRGGQASAACVRVSGAELGYETDLEFIFPRGLAVFAAGGDLAFHHGGISLQEMVVPVLTLRMASGAAAQSDVSRVFLDEHPATITNRMFTVRVGVTALLSEGAVAARLVLVGPDGSIAGQTGMAVGVEAFDKTTGVLRIASGASAQIGMMLVDDQAKKVRIVAQDPNTDAVLAQTADLPVELLR